MKKEKVILWGTGKPRREFVFSEDVANASIFAVLNVENLKNQHYNIGTGIDYSLDELAERIAKFIGFKGKIEWDINMPDGTPQKLLDSSNIRSLGWSPSVNLDEGLRHTYTDFKCKMDFRR